MSIEKQLYDLIEAKGFLTYFELKNWCDTIPCKISTAERKLRKLAAEKKIEPIFEKHYISEWQIKKNIQKKKFNLSFLI